MQGVHVVLRLAAALTALVTLSEGATSEVNHGEAHIEWLRSKGGFFNPKVAIRHFNESDPKSPTGLFAAENIPKKETLMIVPQSCLITSGGSKKMCDTARILAKEMKLGHKSNFAPYVTYLLDGKRGLLPSAWSEAGKELIETIVGNELLPRGVTDISFKRKCKSSGDPLEEDAYLFVVARSWEHIIIPVLDMINHRNRPWTNVDSNAAYEDKDITAFATRDIVAGEQLYLSYDECTNCEGDAHTFGAPHILKDFGFVEQYPQRWLFHAGPDVLFDLDEKPNVGNMSTTAGKEQIELTWQSNKPETHQINFLRGHLKRLQDLRELVTEGSKHLVSSHERDVTLEYYAAVTTALENAIWAAGAEEATHEEKCVISDTGDPGTCSAALSREYDGLEEKPERYDDIEDSSNSKFKECKKKCGRKEKLTEEQHKKLERCMEMCSSKFENVDHNWLLCEMKERNLRKKLKANKYEKIDKTESYYTEIEVLHNKEESDTCLFLDKDLHACSSFRPHYHEVLVHYSARFVDEIKRVVFIGGGDSMLVHEVVKYPSLELVVGLELDQQIVRSSFKNFGTQPHYDNEKVQWWYGDAARSLQLIPSEYYGTFDLVFVDLTSEVIDFLKVTEKLSIMDAAVLLLAPGGVIARNEDFYLNFYWTSTDFTDYTVDLTYHDVPLICHQSISIGSNAVDFLTRPPKEQNVETVFLEPVDGTSDHFGCWYNYRKNSTRANRLCKEGETEEKELAKQTSSYGVLMIIEAEDAAAPLKPPSSVQASARKALEKAGLTIVSTSLSASYKKQREVDAVVFILHEGYVEARTWAEHKYCAFDLMLWSTVERQNAAKTELIAAVGSKAGKSSSSYRIVTGGMFGVSTWKEDSRNVGPRVTELCEHRVDPVQDAPVKESPIHEVLVEGVSLILDTSIIVVLCGEQLRPCSSLDVLVKEDTAKKVIPVWTCPNVGDDTAHTEDASQHMFDCEINTLRSLRASIEAEGKIGGIVIDPEVPRVMGQILHKIFTSAAIRREFLPDKYAILAPMLDPPDSWRKALLDRFRTDFDKFDPAFRAEAFFNTNSSRFGLGVFSSGDANFYPHFADMIMKIEGKTGFVSDVRNVKDGLLNYVADFEVSHFASHSDYDQSSSLEQWLSQQPLGLQTIFRFDSKNVLSTAQVKEAFRSALLFMDSHADMQVYDNVGDGCVIVAFWSAGDAILVWDGRAHIDINFITYLEDFDLPDDFEGLFMEKIPSLKLGPWEQQPRGFGRVVNFQKDLKARDERPHWWKN